MNKECCYVLYIFALKEKNVVSSPLLFSTPYALGVCSSGSPFYSTSRLLIRDIFVPQISGSSRRFIEWKDCCYYFAADLLNAPLCLENFSSFTVSFVVKVIRLCCCWALGSSEMWREDERLLLFRNYLCCWWNHFIVIDLFAIFHFRLSLYSEASYI